LQENVSGNDAELTDLGLRQLDLLPGSGTDFEETIDYVIQKRLLHSLLLPPKSTSQFDAMMRRRRRTAAGV